LSKTDKKALKIVEVMEIIHTVVEDNTKIFWRKNSNLYAETNSVQVALVLNTRKL